MNTKFKLTLALLAGVAIGVTAIQGLNAQIKPLAYLVTEIDVTDPAVYQTYVDRNSTIFTAGGGRWLVRGEKLVALEGDGLPPKRFAIGVFDTMEQAQAYRASTAYKEIVPMRDKSSKYRAFLAEGSISTTVGR
jgi:uncharacterized protein (DUF1330 family)